MLTEHLYRYPRWLTWPIELISGIVVGWAAISAMRALLLLLWQRWPLDSFILKHVPQMAELRLWMARTGPDDLSLRGLLPTLAWLLAALVLTLVLRNLFPAVRFSVRGLLVWFSNDWVAIPWEAVRAIRVTEAGQSGRFFVLVQTDGAQLTPWHRVYSFLYRLGLRRGFLISSSLEDGEGLLREMMEEVRRRRKLGEQLNLTIDDQSRSLLFSFLLSPLSLLRPSSAAAEKPVFQPVATAATLGSAAALTMPSMGGASMPAGASSSRSTPVNETIQALYPNFVQIGLNVATVLIVGFALWRYLAAWTTFLIFQFEAVRQWPFFRDMPVSPLISPWGLLLGAHLGLALVGAVVLMLRHMFPAVTVDSAGIVFTALGRSERLAWEQVAFVKATDLRAEQHVVLVEAVGKTLPWYYVMGSWLYDGGAGRGALIWPIVQPFEPLMQRIALELTRRQQPDQPVRLRDDAPGWMLLLALRPADALDRLVLLHQTDDDMPQGLVWGAVLRATTAMLWNALGPALLLLTYWMMYKGLLFSFQVPLMLALALIWGLTEWPLASFLASSIDQMAGAGNKGYQGLYLYPTAQLPRLLLLVLAVLLTLMGFPNLALLAWAGGIAWSGLLTAGLWEALYGWRGVALLGGSVMTVFFQLLTFLGVLVLRG
jgi:hypothetical protein